MNVYRLESYRFDPKYVRFRRSNPRTFPEFHPRPDAVGAWNPPSLAATWKPHKLIGDIWADNDFPCEAGPVNLVPVFSPRAVEGLRDFLEPNGELLPVITPLGTYYAYNVTTVVDALDPKQSGGRWYDPNRRRTREIYRFRFRNKLIEKLTLFKLPQLPVDIYVTEPFVQRVRELKFNGMWITKCWPIPPGVRWLDTWNRELERQRASETNVFEKQRVKRISKATRAPRVLDLRKDVEALQPLIQQLTRIVERQQEKWAATDSYASAIGLESIGWDNETGVTIMGHIDIRDVHETDSTWSHFGVARLKRPQWTALLTALEESDTPREVIDLRGKRHSTGEEDDRFSNWFGQVMVEAFRLAKSRGTFKTLLKPARCALYVNDHDSGFAWSSKR